jgi:RNA polymerase sigma factor (sigma-70 family)
MTKTKAHVPSSVDQFFNSMGRYKVLDPALVIELARKVQAWRQHPDGPDACPPIIKSIGLVARNKLVAHNLRLVVRIWRDCYAMRVTAKDPGLADMFQLSAQQLVRAAELFDPLKGRTFSTYASTWIHKGMKEFIGGQRRTVRIPLSHYFIIKAALLIQSNRSAAGLPKLSMTELVDEMSQTRQVMPTPEQLGDWIRCHDLTDLRSFSERLGDEKTELGDLIASRQTEGDDANDAVQRARDAMADLTTIERRVVEKMHLRGRGSIGYRTCAKVLKISELQVRAAEARAFDQIKLSVSVD